MQVLGHRDHLPCEGFLSPPRGGIEKKVYLIQPFEYSLGIIYGYSYAVQPFNEGLGSAKICCAQWINTSRGVDPVQMKACFMAPLIFARKLVDKPACVRRRP